MPAWWVPAAAAATLVLAVPVALAVAERRAPATVTASPAPPEDAPPSFVLVLHGRWPDAAATPPAEARERAREYWAWTASLAERGLLLAAGDLRWEPGARLGPSGAPVGVAEAAVADPDFVVGMFAVRVATYDEAVALARDCPHLRYGGSVSVRRVGGGFVTAPGGGDWSG